MPDTVLRVLLFAFFRDDLYTKQTVRFHALGMRLLRERNHGEASTSPTVFISLR